MSLSYRLFLSLAIAAAPLTAQQPAATPPDPRLDAIKKELIADIDTRAVFTQQMVDQIFSFGELGFQEIETSKFLVDLLLGDRKSVV